MKLVKTRCKKEEYKQYYDLVLCFVVKGQEKKIRVRPCFWRDMGALKEIAEDVKE